MAGAGRIETAERVVDLGKVTECAATRALGLLLGAERLTLTGADRRATVRAVSACTPFRFFIRPSSGFPSNPRPLHLRPLHQGPQCPPPDQMQVQVVDLLAAVGVAVDDQPVAALGNAMLAREVARD